MNMNENNNNLGEGIINNENDNSIEKNQSKELFSTSPPIEPSLDSEKLGNIDDNKNDLKNNQQDQQTINSIAVVRNDGQNKITILSSNKSWVIQKYAQILLTSVPSWVKQNPEFQAYRRDKILIYTNIVATKKQI